MRRLRRVQTEQVKTPTEIALDRLLELSKKIALYDQAYREACELDQRGEYDKADEGLRRAGVCQDEIAQRRRYVDWQRQHGFSDDT